MFDTGELDDMRQAVAESLTDTCQVLRRVSAPDDLGGSTGDYSAIASNVPCRVALPNSGIPGVSQLGQIVAERLGNRPFKVATFPHGQDVQAGDQVTINGDLYDVLAIVTGPFALATRAAVIQVE